MKVVLVTGSSSGIGKAIALRLCAAGDRVVLHGRDEQRLKAAMKEAADRGGEALAVRGDLRDENQTDRLVQEAAARWGRLDGLVNNAGSALRDAPVDRCSAEEFDRMISENLCSVFLASRAALPFLRKSRGAIVNVSSNLGRVHLHGLAAYSAAKAGVESLTRSMAFDYGRDGVRVNSVLPGLVRTPAAENDPSFGEQKRLYESRAALGRIGEPDDVAGIVQFLLSADAAWITGQGIVIDGGY